MMTPVFMFSVLCSTDDTSKLVPSVEQSTENTKTGAIGGAEHRKMKTTDYTSFYVFGTLLHR
jgi:hypothetical protein